MFFLACKLCKSGLYITRYSGHGQCFSIFSVLPFTETARLNTNSFRKFSWSGNDIFGNFLKGTLSGLRQFLATESPLKMMKNAFYFTSKAHFVLKIFKLLSWHFDHVSKRLDWNDTVNFKLYDFTAWIATFLNTYCPISRQAKEIRQWNLAS